MSSRQGWLLLLSLLLPSFLSSCLFSSVSQTHSIPLLSKVFDQTGLPSILMSIFLLSSIFSFRPQQYPGDELTKFTLKYEKHPISPRCIWLRLAPRMFWDILFEQGHLHVLSALITPLYLVSQEQTYRFVVQLLLVSFPLWYFSKQLLTQLGLKCNYYLQRTWKWQGKLQIHEAINHKLINMKKDFHEENEPYFHFQISTGENEE